MEEEDYCITPYSEPEPEEPLDCNENEDLNAALPGLTQPKNSNLSFKGPPPPPPPPSSWQLTTICVKLQFRSMNKVTKNSFDDIS